MSDYRRYPHLSAAEEIRLRPWEEDDTMAPYWFRKLVEARDAQWYETGQYSFMCFRCGAAQHVTVGRLDERDRRETIRCPTCFTWNTI